MHRKPVSKLMKIMIALAVALPVAGAAAFVATQAVTGLGHADYASRLVMVRGQAPPAVKAGPIRTEHPVHANVVAAAPRTHYTVRTGNTLSSIARHLYGHANRWPSLWWANRHKVSNPNAITVGLRLKLPAHARHRAWLTRAAMRAIPKPKPVHVVLTSSNSNSGGSSAPQAPSGGGCGLSGTLSFGQLEQLWECAGGSSGVAATAACIAEHESSGNQFATGPFGERGYWQINPVNGPVLSTYDPEGNARAAVSMSNDGSNWSAWTTAASCGV